MTRQSLFIDLIAKKLQQERASIQKQWKHPEGTSTKHFVIDNVLPDEVCMQIYNAFPRDGGGFFNRESFREKKRTSADLSAYDAILADITFAYQDKRIVELVAEMVGYTKIEPDPKLYAGGLSMMFKNDFLNPHIDNSHDAERAKFRRLNLLYYVTPQWRFENGGNFELWNEDRTQPKTLVSQFNRLVVMETNKTSWHSVSPVVTEGPRCCVSNYYFSEISPDETEYFHVTSFTGRPGDSLKRAVGVVDNALRNTVSKLLKTGRGKDLMNKDK